MMSYLLNNSFRKVKSKRGKGRSKMENFTDVKCPTSFRISHFLYTSYYSFHLGMYYEQESFTEHKKKLLAIGDMAQQLKALDILAENQGFASRIHLVTHTQVQLQFQGTPHSFCRLCTPWHIYICAAKMPKYELKIKEILKELHNQNIIKNINHIQPRILFYCFIVRAIPCFKLKFVVSIESSSSFSRTYKSILLSAYVLYCFVVWGIYVLQIIVFSYGFKVFIYL